MHVCPHSHPLVRGRVAGAAAQAGGPRLSFPRPQLPALTGGWRLYLRSRPFGYHPSLMTIGEDILRALPCGSALFSSQRCGKANKIPLLRFSGQSHAPLFPHSRTRLRGTWTPSHGLRTHFLDEMFSEFVMVQYMVKSIGTARPISLILLFTEDIWV